jgi:putative ABC transport system permease protein
LPADAKGLGVKPIEAKNQVSLGPARCMQLALTGMSFRLFRSGITMAILALAVAFLVHMLAHGLIAREVQQGAWVQLAQSRAMGELVNRLTVPDTRPIILAELAGDDAGRLEEYRRWGGLDEPTYDWVRRTAVRHASVAATLDALPEQHKTVLLGDLDPVQRLATLTSEREYDLFVQRLDDVGVRMPLGDQAAFRRLVQEDRPRLIGYVDAIRAGHARAIAQVRDAFPGRSAQDLAEDPPADFVATLASAGYAFESDDLPVLTAFARYVRDRRVIGEYGARPDVRAAIARRTNLSLAEINFDSTMDAINSAAQAQWFADELRQARAPAHLDAERVMAVADRYKRERKLQAAIGDTSPIDETTFMGLSERAAWLIALSFIVCVVGVANAMLMSVTERFTEIATMKCLGAMDRFVMMMFVFEAVIQGIFGGLIGLALGIVLALMRSFAEYGTLVFEAGAAIGDVVIASLLSLLVGVVLAAVAAVGPSFIAARLAPMEAMRVE